MKPRVVKSSEVEEEDYGVLKVMRLFHDESLKNVSVSRVKVSGENKKVRNLKSDLFYYVIEGSGVFSLNDERYEVEAGDLVFIPKGVAYQDSGELTFLVIYHPKFSRDDVEVLK